MLNISEINMKVEALRCLTSEIITMLRYAPEAELQVKIDPDYEDIRTVLSARSIVNGMFFQARGMQSWFRHAGIDPDIELPRKEFGTAKPTSED
jgi:hypothetical protein